MRAFRNPTNPMIGLHNVQDTAFGLEPSEAITNPRGLVAIRVHGVPSFYPSIQLLKETDCKDGLARGEDAGDGTAILSNTARGRCRERATRCRWPTHTCGGAGRASTRVVPDKQTLLSSAHD